VKVRLLVFAMVFACGVFGSTTDAADVETVTVAAAKAAFIYNFSKFVIWPGDVLAPSQPLALCVLGDNAVADALGRTARTRTDDPHALSVQIVRTSPALRSCHMLYVTGLDAKHAAELIDVLKGAAVFTISDSDRFAETGGVVRLIFEDNHLRFAINVASAHRARLNLSSRLLSLAQLVKDDLDVQH
jgi:hypothetical protein